MGIKLGLVGLGSFGSCFAPLFSAHPLVDSVILCDAEESRIKRQLDNPGIAAKTDIAHCTTDFDELCKSDVDGIVIITQPWLHAPQCIQAMKAGKFVYSAVPVICIPDDDEVLDWCQKIIDTVKETGMEYMLGETTIYRPQTMFCRRKALAGEFGDFVYAEAEYCHDVDCFTCSLRQVAISRGTGKIGAQRESFMKKYNDRGLKGYPFTYPTHSVSGVLEVMRTMPRSVSCIGYANRNNDPHFKNAEYNNMVAFYHLENGASFRCAELREISPNIGLADEDFRIFGTRGSYSLNHWHDNGRIAPTPEPKKNNETIVSDQDMRDPLPKEVAKAYQKMLDPNAAEDTDFVPGGHGGSHPYLVHEFVNAVNEHRRPAISAWHSAMYMAMGIAAHKSAQKDGETIKIQSFGNPWNI